jgi:replication-associated recombination protein RarA
MTPLVDKYKPLRLSEFAGLRGPCGVLTKLTANPYPSAWLLIGESGLGKTTAAFAVGLEMKAQVHHLASRQCDLEAVDRLVSSCRCAPMFAESRYHVAIVDEADRMTQAAQLAFLSVLDGTVPCPNTVFFFTTNDPSNLEVRFRSRCRPLHFRPEAEAHTAFLRAVWAKETTLPAPDLAAILASAGGNLRSALNTLEVELIAPGSFEPAEALTEQRLPILLPHRRDKNRKPDNWRVAAAKKAWVTIRANRAAAAAKAGRRVRRAAA